MSVPVLYLSYDGMTDPLGQSQVLPYICGLTQQGYKFTLISFEKKERYATDKAIIEAICQKNNIEWHPLMYTKKPPVLSTLNDIRQMRRLTTLLHKKNNFSIVHCRSYIAALVGLRMKERYGTRFIFDMRGLWADERVDGGLWPQTNFLYKTVYRFFKKKEIAFLNNADHTISLTHNAKKEILSWPQLRSPAIPLTVIPCCVDTEHFNPGKISENDITTLKDRLQIKSGQTTIAYYGSIGTWYLLNEMLAYYQQLLQNNADTIFLFVTPDPPESIFKVSRPLGIPDNHLRIVSAKRSEMPGYIAVCDYSIFFIKPSYSKRASSPTKQGEIMSMGKPIICNSNVGDTDLIVEEYASGYAIDHFTNSEYNKGIDKMKDYHSFDPEHIRAGALSYFSLAKGVEQYAAIYKGLS